MRIQDRGGQIVVHLTMKLCKGRYRFRLGKVRYGQYAETDEGSWHIRRLERQTCGCVSTVDIISCSGMMRQSHGM